MRAVWRQTASTCSASSRVGTTMTQLGCTGDGLVVADDDDDEDDDDDDAAAAAAAAAAEAAQLAWVCAMAGSR
jgi:hypothetical protein